MSLNRPCRVLLVEDNPAEVRLLKEAFEQSGTSLELHMVANGEEALDFVYHRNAQAEKPRPDIILLDINLPRINGHEVLRTIKGDPGLKGIPVLILSGSGLRKDVRSAYDHHANAYLQKPSDLADYFHLVSQLQQFWVQTVALPATTA
jgi:two-component system, chemotaxis family, response regulator Rcp1